MSQLPVVKSSAANAIRDASGDQTGPRSNRLLKVSRCSPVPSPLTTYSSRSPSARFDANTIFPPAAKARPGKRSAAARSPTIQMRCISVLLSGARRPLAFASPWRRALNARSTAAQRSRTRDGKPVLRRVACPRRQLRLEVVRPRLAGAERETLLRSDAMPTRNADVLQVERVDAARPRRPERDGDSRRRRRQTRVQPLALPEAHAIHVDVVVPEVQRRRHRARQRRERV